ncbi:MAG: DOMON-like domain-containing protein [Croceibacterium sp.]
MYALLPHPAFPPASVTHVEAKIIGHDASWLRARWRIDGAAGLVVPPFAGKGRADELWRTTCFELFLKPKGSDAYCELNLSPSERWNAYNFDHYRDGMRERPFPREPECTMRLGSTFAIFDAAIPVDGLPAGPSAMGLCAIIEEQGGVKSFWALAHPEAKPDFHLAPCFAAELAAPGA